MYTDFLQLFVKADERLLRNLTGQAADLPLGRRHFPCTYSRISCTVPERNRITINVPVVY
jgi:hypothetical protein